MRTESHRPFKVLLGASLAGVLSMASVSARAVEPGDLGDLTNQTVSIGNSFATGSFNDIYVFDISALSAVVGTTVTITLDIPQLPGTEFALSNMQINLKDSLNNMIALDNTLDASNALQVSASLATGLDYQFIVSGTVTGTLGGSYGGVLAAVTTPVPEAETWAMLLAGLGMVGLGVRGRRR